MDDRTYYLAVGALAASVACIFLDAALPSFDVPSGFWAVPSAVLAFLGVRAGLRPKDQEQDEQ